MNTFKNQRTQEIKYELQNLALNSIDNDVIELLIDDKVHCTAIAKIVITDNNKVLTFLGYIECNEPKRISSEEELLYTHKKTKEQGLFLEEAANNINNIDYLNVMRDNQFHLQNHPLKDLYVKLENNLDKQNLILKIFVTGRSSLSFNHDVDLYAKYANSSGRIAIPIQYHDFFQQERFDYYKQDDRDKSKDVEFMNHLLDKKVNLYKDNLAELLRLQDEFKSIIKIIESLENKL